ncbi:hypothetical protein AB5I41_06745 [Sphingomonas sp. MMS24-JH45]
MLVGAYFLLVHDNGEFAKNNAIAGAAKSVERIRADKAGDAIDGEAK